MGLSVQNLRAFGASWWRMSGPLVLSAPHCYPNSVACALPRCAGRELPCPDLGWLPGGRGWSPAGRGVQIALFHPLPALPRLGRAAGGRTDHAPRGHGELG